jgi:hypothetical protein
MSVIWEWMISNMGAGGIGPGGCHGNLVPQKQS